MKHEIKTLIKGAVKKLYPGVEVEFSVDFAPDKVDADFASNVALILAKKVGKKPMEVAEEIISAIVPSPRPSTVPRGVPSPARGEGFNVEAMAPGFLNFKVNDEVLYKNLAEILKQKDKYGEPEKKNKVAVLVEYFQPNIAKPLHIGHMRSAIIGDCLFRLEQLFVKKVESDTHMGDWGTQFGLLLYAYKQWGDEKIVSKDPIAELNKLYIKVNAEIEKKPEVRDLGKAEFVKLEQGDKENKKLWEKFVKWSMERFAGIYELLDIRKHDHNWPESFYEDKMPPVIEMLKKAGLLKESQGAQIVDLAAYNLGTAIIIKSDGGTTYLLRDIATYLYRKNKEKFTKQLYVVDSRQIHAFRQLFKIIELLGEWKEGSGEHIDFGFMSLPKGALSTRKGNVIELEKLVEETIKKAEEIIKQKNPDLKNSKTVAREIAIGALKYFDLSQNRHSDIVFTWEKALNFEGNTGAYIQYTHARIKSILRKADDSAATKDFKFTIPIERNLLTFLQTYSFMIETAAIRYQPKIVADYLFGLSSIFNQYYQEVIILKEEDKILRKSRLALIQGAAQVLRNGLHLLGIKAPEEM